VDSSNADFVTDDVTDRFCLLGPAEAQIEKLHALERAGVTQFNIYLMCGDEEDTLEKYKAEVLPAFGK
jgi:alkanesulfonate monooxygenase SsuD/methylene tetrahydromethanopterin reductase-like flavin-dependent oxidoreductase (luciferase family)